MDTKNIKNPDHAGIKILFLSLKPDSYGRKFWSLFGGIGPVTRYVHQTRPSTLKITIPVRATARNHPEITNKWDIIFQYDNAIQRVSLTGWNKLLAFDWDTLILNHLPYSPDIALFDYYLFHSLKHFGHQKK